MRVVHVFKDFYPPTTGGIEQHMRVLCAGLARHVDVAVLVPSRSLRRIEDHLDGVRIIRAPELGRYLSAPLCPSMPAELRRLAPDIVHLHFPNPTGDLAYLLSGCRSPVVLTYHADIVKQRALLWLYRPIFTRLDRHIDRIIVTSQQYAVSSSFLPRYRDKCVVIPFGVDLDSFALRDGEWESVERLRRQHGRRLVLFMGVLRYYKGLHVLLHAMTKVAGRLLVAGRGQSAALEALATKLNIADRVTFCGEVSESDRRVLLHACDAFVLPSIDRSEAFGIVQLEAMACGKAVVSTDLPTGVRAVNRHEMTGLLVPPGDPDAVAGALNRLLGDHDLRASLGRAAREHVERDFTAERMVASTLALYDQVASRSDRHTLISA